MSQHNEIVSDLLNHGAPSEQIAEDCASAIEEQATIEGVNALELLKKADDGFTSPEFAAEHAEVQGIINRVMETEPPIDPLAEFLNEMEREMGPLGDPADAMDDEETFGNEEFSPEAIEIINQLKRTNEILSRLEAKL